MTEPHDLPFDIRLMTVTTQVLWGLLALWCASVLVLWGVQHPVWTIRAIVVQGDVTHQNTASLRAHLALNMKNSVSASFLTADIAQVRRLFESAPWVQRAWVKREFPNRLRVTLQEHVPVAWWGNADSGQLLSRTGVVFEASLSEIDGLPELAGPSAQSSLVWATYQRIQPVLEQQDLRLVRLELTERGNWLGELDNGATLELGRGSTDELAARTQAFTATLNQLTHRYAAALQSVDLRYPNGYALRLHGVSTVVDEAQASPPPAAAPAVATPTKPAVQTR